MLLRKKQTVSIFETVCFLLVFNNLKECKKLNNYSCENVNSDKGRNYTESPSDDSTDNGNPTCDKGCEDYESANKNTYDKINYDSYDKVCYVLRELERKRKDLAQDKRVLSFKGNSQRCKML